jgi:cephalosporin hydroxylase
MGELDSFDEAVSYLRSIDAEKIDAHFIERELMPRTGFGPIAPFLPPYLQKRCGHGVWVQQMPNQFAPYLKHLIDRRVSSYLEVGAAHGGSFVLTCEILAKFRSVEATIISMTGKSKFLRHYEKKHGASFEFFSLDSHSHEALDVFRSRQWDHVFLDGDHSRDGMLNDFEFASKSARMIALHDIHNIACRPGMEAWATIKREFSDAAVFEFVDQYPEQWPGKKMPGMGIGLIEY